MRRFIQTILRTKASENLDEKIQEELNIPDPSPEKAEAILKNEDTEEHDGESGS
jgi:hypothetical protein